MRKLKHLILLGLILLIVPFIFSCREVYYSKISFETNGGNKIEAIEGEVGSNLNLPTPIYESYDFLGWYKDSNLKVKFTDKFFPKNSLKLYAKWDIKEYNFNLFKMNGEDNEKILLKENELVKLPVPELKGFIFTGWYLDADYKQELKQENLEGSKNVNLYAKYDRVDDSYAFVGTNGKAQAKGIIDDPLDLYSGLNKYNNLYILPGEYIIDKEIMALQGKNIRGIGEVAFNFSRINKELVVDSNNIIKNLNIIGSSLNGLKIIGSNNLLTSLKIEGALGNGIVLDGSSANNNMLKAIEVLNNHDNGILLNEIGTNNCFDSIVAINNESNGLRLNAKNKDYPLISITNSIFNDNGNSESPASFESGNGLYLGNLERNLFIRLQNVIASDNKNNGIYSEAIGGIVLDHITLYNNKINLFMANGMTNKLINSLSYNQSNNADIFNGYALNSSLVGKSGLLEFTDFQRKIDTNGKLNLNFSLDPASLNLSYTIKNESLIAPNYLKTNLEYGAFLEESQNIDLVKMNELERIIWLLDLEHLISGAILPNNIAGLKIKNMVEALDENEVSLYGNHLLKINPVDNSNLQLEFKSLAKELVIELPKINYDIDFEITNYKADYLVGEEFNIPKIIIYNKDNYDILSSNAYNLQINYYVISNDGKSKAEEVDTNEPNTYEIQIIIQHEGVEKINYSYQINVLDNPKTLINADDFYIDPLGNLTGELQYGVGEIYTISVLGGSKKPTNIQVIDGKNYDDVAIASKSCNRIESRSFKFAGYNYNENYDYYLVYKNGLNISDSIKINHLEKTIVASRGELEAAIKTKKPYIALGNDINLEGINYSLGNFSGYFDGANHELYGLKIKDRNSLDSIGLFNKLENAYIYNLKINNFYIDSDAKMAGILAGYSNNLVAENIKIRFSTVNSSYYSGGLIGKTEGNISLKKVEFLSNQSHSIHAIYSGGLIGLSNNSGLFIEDINLTLRIAGDYSGGIIGKINLDTIRNRAEINRVFIRSSITGFKASAGILAATNILNNLHKIKISGAVIDSIFTEKNSYSIINNINLMLQNYSFNDTYNTSSNLAFDNAYKTIKFEEINQELLASIFDLNGTWNFDENKHEIRLK